MERSSKRGKIPQQDWPSIIKRYEDGETLAGIARTYDCSPPAISYIISRSRSRDATERAEPTEIEAPEAQLVKGPANDMPTAEAVSQRSEINEAAAPGAATHPSYPSEGPAPTPLSGGDLSSGLSEAFDGGAENVLLESPGDSAYQQTAPSPRAPQIATIASPGTEDVQLSSGEHRRTLHLSLSHRNPQRGENPHDGAARLGSAHNSSRPVENQPLEPTRHFAHQNSAATETLDNGGNGSLAAGQHQPRGGGAFIDRALRQRVDGDISAFLAAFDAALADDTIESRAGLREATDRLLRAGARTRIELERLEARSPLSARDTGGYSVSNWRMR